MMLGCGCIEGACLTGFVVCFFPFIICDVWLKFYVVQNNCPSRSLPACLLLLLFRTFFGSGPYLSVPRVALLVTAAYRNGVLVD